MLRWQVTTQLEAKLSPEGMNQTNYDRDFYAWANEQAALLRAGRLASGVLRLASGGIGRKGSEGALFLSKKNKKSRL